MKTEKIQTPIYPGPTGWSLALERAPHFLGVVLLFVLPLLAPKPGTDPFSSKWALSQILIFLMAGAWSLRAYFMGRLVWTFSRSHWALGLLILWLFLTVLISPYRSFCWMALGDNAVYPLWYLILTFTCLETWRAENLFISFLLSGLVTGFWAVGQALGLGDAQGLTAIQTQFGGRVMAGLERPDCLAAFLLMIWPLALGLLIRAEKTAPKILWSLLFLVSLAALFLTGSFAGWMGFIAGTLVFIPFTIMSQGKKASPWIALLLVFVILSVSLDPMEISIKGWFYKNGQDILYQQQIGIGAEAMIHQKPIQGFGFGSFVAAFPPFGPPFLALHPFNREVSVTHASNGLLEWTAETGIVGLLMLGAFIFYILAQWWKLYQANAIPKPLAIGVFAALAGVGVDNLFDSNIYQPFILLPLLFLSAFPVALSQRFYRIEGYPIQRYEKDISKYKTLLLPLLIGILVLVFLQVGNVFQRQVAYLYLSQGQESYRKGGWDKAIEALDHTLKLDSNNFVAKYDRGAVYLDRNKPGDMALALLDLNDVGRVLPDFQKIHLKKYEALIQMNRADEAASELRSAIRLDPMLVYLLGDFKKARQLVEDHHLSEALVIYQSLFMDYPTCVPMLIDYANALAMTRDFGSAVNLYKSVLRLDPENPKALSDLQKVREVWKKADDIQSSKGNVLGGELR